MRGYSNVEDLDRQFNAQHWTRVRTGGGYTETWATFSTFVGVLSDASARVSSIAASRQLFVSHQIVAEGAPVAAVGDRLIPTDYPTSSFRVQMVENPGLLDDYAIYGVTEET